jgi:MFS family permease
MDNQSQPIKDHFEDDDQNKIKHIEEETSDVDKLKTKTMQISITEGSFGVFSNTLSDNYIIPFALSIGSTPFQVGMLYSCGGLFSPIGQIIASRRIEKKSRKTILIQGIIGQACIWPLFLLIAVLFMHNLLINFLAWILIGLYLIYMLNSGIMTPPWFSVMGDVVPEDRRGRYFAKRNLITTGIALLGTLLFSFALDWYKDQQQVMIGFIMIFLIGLITRVISAFLFTKHYYPPFNFQPSDQITLTRFFHELPKENFGKFTLFVALVTFGQWIAGPFFSVYMLEELNFNYSIFIFVNLFASIVALFFFPVLGKLSDRVGNVQLLRLGAIIIPILPLMWIFVLTPFDIILGPQLLGGIGWTAFNLAASNFIYDNIPSEKRGESLALYNLLLGCGIVLGGLTGSIIITFVPITFMNKFHFLFLISGIVRIISVMIFLPKIKEIRITDTKPIFNLKNTSLYRWIYDLTLREPRKKRRLK